MSSSSSTQASQDNTVRYKKRKANFTFSEVHILLDEVRKNRHVVVGNFNSGVPSEVKRRKWAEITDQVNEIGECDREVGEIIKKWSDLKCDTKRKIAALQSGNVPHTALAQAELTPTECIVESILELDQKPWEAVDGARARRRSSEQDGGLDEDEDGGFLALGSVHSSPGLSNEMKTMPPPAGGASDSLQDTPNTADPDSHLMDSDDDQQDIFPSSSLPSVTNSHADEDGAPAAPANSTPHVSSSTSHAHSQQAPPPDVAREQLVQNASLSVQEQHTTNALLATMSRSLELMAESVQQLAETQQEFVRESLQLQRETVQVLREFATGALTLLHEKVNGKPPLL